MRVSFFSALLALALLFQLAAAPCAAASGTEKALNRLRDLTASVQSIRCAFTQTTTIPLFAEPVVSEGRFLFKKPDSLVWEYTAPLAQGLAFSGGEGFRWEGGKENRIPFKTADDPVAGLIAAQMLAWIRFDRAWIETHYTVTAADTVTEDGAPAPALNPALSLTLEPKRPEVRSILTSLDLRFGADGIARSILLRETAGGTTAITFHGVAVNVPVDDGEFR